VCSPQHTSIHGINNTHSVRSRHTLAFTDEGLVFAWGWAALGQLGVSPSENRFPIHEERETPLDFKKSLNSSPAIINNNNKNNDNKHHHHHHHHHYHLCCNKDLVAVLSTVTLAEAHPHRPRTCLTLRPHSQEEEAHGTPPCDSLNRSAPWPRLEVWKESAWKFLPVACTRQPDSNQATCELASSLFSPVFHIRQILTSVSHFFFQNVNYFFSLKICMHKVTLGVCLPLVNWGVEQA
jgi:hypothetical protein